MKMGPRFYYAPDGVPAGATDGREGQSGQPDSTNAAGTDQLAKWQAQLPKDMRGNDAFKGINDLGTLGSNYIRMSAELAELKAAKRSEQGKGDNPEPEKSGKVEPVKYENFEAKLGDQVDPSGMVSSRIAEYLQSKNIPQKDAEELVKETAKYFEESMKQIQQHGPEMADEYNRRRWDKEYDTNKALVLRSEQAVFGANAEFQKAVEKSGIKTIPEYWDVMRAVGLLIAEDQGAPFGGVGKKSSGVPIDYSKPSE